MLTYFGYPYPAPPSWLHSSAATLFSQQKRSLNTGVVLNSIVEVSDRLILPHLICKCNAARFAKYCLNSFLETPLSRPAYDTNGSPTENFGH